MCAAKGYELMLTLPQGMSREREGLLRLYGARVEVTESLGGMTEAVEAARALATREDVFLPDQFSNPANPEIHRRTTGPEIWEALDGRVDVFVAGVGTGGTITGVGEMLKERNPRCASIAVEPSASAVLSGGAPGPHKIQGIGAGFVPAVLNREVLDEVIAVDDEDAIETARLLARREGVLAGISGGAAVWAALEVARRPDSRGARIVDDPARLRASAMSRRRSSPPEARPSYALADGRTARWPHSGRDPPRRGGRPQPRSRGARRRYAGDPRHVARRACAAGAPRRPRPARRRRAAAAAADRRRRALGDRDRDPSRRRGSATACSSTMGWAS